MFQEGADQWMSRVLVGFFPSLHLKFQQYYVNEAISFISGYGEAGQTGMSFGCRSEGRRGMALWEQMLYRKVGEHFSGHWKFWRHVQHKLTHKDTLQDWCHSIYGLFSLEMWMVVLSCYSVGLLSRFLLSECSQFINLSEGDRDGCVCLDNFTGPWLFFNSLERVTATIASSNAIVCSLLKNVSERKKKWSAAFLHVLCGHSTVWS